MQQYSVERESERNQKQSRESAQKHVENISVRKTFEVLSGVKSVMQTNMCSHILMHVHFVNDVPLFCILCTIASFTLTRVVRMPEN